MINIIVALDNKNGFARGGKIPWYFPEDFRYFKEKTQGSVCVMGRNTYLDLCNIRSKQLLKGEELLPNRKCLILTSKDLEMVNGCSCIKSLDECLDYENAFLIGGRGIYVDGLKYADNVYLTRILKDYDCDVFFPFYEMVEKFSFTSSEKSGMLDFQVWSKKE